MNNYLKIGSMIGATLLLAACNPPSESEQKAQKAQVRNEQIQNENIARATAEVPAPIVDNFLARENLSEYMKRMDDPSKTWYIYVIADNGTELGYYVSSSYPQSVCTFMTPPENLTKADLGRYNGHVVTTAPALDGVYYKGGGCDTKFFFDVSSDAMILISGMNIWTSDVPLDLEAPRLTVKVEENLTEEEE